MTTGDGRCVHPLICPICGEGLVQANGQLACANRHSFDIARQGYVNLLLPRQSSARILGDSREMLQARRDFLAQGHYLPLSDGVNALALHALEAVTAEENAILDAGCGEGYYIGRLKGQLDERLPGSSLCYFGVDLSKDAARMAAVAHRQIRFVVASTHDRLPFADRSLRLLLNIFAPRNAAEFARLLPPGRHLLVALPQPHHLEALRAALALLEIEENKEQRLLEQLEGSFRLVERRSIEYDLQLDETGVQQLVRMTPNHWHQTEPAPGDPSLDRFETRAAFTLLLFERLSRMS